MENLHNFLYDSGNYDNPLYYFLNLYDFWHLHKFLYDLLDDGRHSFYPLNYLLNRDDSVLNYSDYLGLLDEMVHDSVDLFDPVLIQYFRLLYFYLFKDNLLDRLDNWFLDILFLYPNHLMD